MKILITGSEGMIGKLLVKALKDENELCLIDKNSKNSVDLLKDNIKKYFNGIETVIHLAANSNPRQNKKSSEENVMITWNVLEACKNARVKRVVYASTVNVYDVESLYKSKKIITSSTPICPHTKTDWKAGKGGIFYSISKILCEDLIKSYSQVFKISGVILRIGGVSPNNKPYPDEIFDDAIYLSHEDLAEIVKRAIKFDGFAAIPCVSNNSEEFVDLEPLEKVLGYKPKDDSKYKK